MEVVNGAFNSGNSYRFEARSGFNGGNISMNYIIVQIDIVKQI